MKCWNLVPSDPSSRVARDSLLYCTLAVSRAALCAFALIPPPCPSARALFPSLSASLPCIGYKSDYRVSASPPSAPSNLHPDPSVFRKLNFEVEVAHHDVYLGIDLGPSGCGPGVQGSRVLDGR